MMELSFSLIIFLVSYPWPIRPFYPEEDTAVHEVSATLGDAREDISDPRFHRGIDIPADSGTPVFSIVSDVAIIDSDYVRVGNYVYIHIEPTVENGESVIGILQDSINPTQIGYVVNNHLHLQIGPAGGPYTNPLSYDGGSYNFYDNLLKRYIQKMKFLFDFFFFQKTL